jgi:hypothetical protein
MIAGLAKVAALFARVLKEFRSISGEHFSAIRGADSSQQMGRVKQSG